MGESSGADIITLPFVHPVADSSAGGDHLSRFLRQDSLQAIANIGAIMADSLTLPSLHIKDIERITLDVPFTPRCEEWNALLVRNWRVVEICRVETEGGFVGWGETLP